jgi:hypothetical protein
VLVSRRKWTAIATKDEAFGCPHCGKMHAPFVRVESQQAKYLECQAPKCGGHWTVVLDGGHIVPPGFGPFYSRYNQEHEVKPHPYGFTRHACPVCNRELKIYNRPTKYGYFPDSDRDRCETCNAPLLLTPDGKVERL